MPNFNSTASQILNGTANFLNGVSNAARDVVANPLADMANLGLKTNPVAAAANLATKGKVYKAIDTVTSAAKGEQPNSLQKQPNDPTSIAQATGEGLTRGVDQALGLLTLTDLARHLPKAAQAGWKTILNKVKDAKSKSQQMKLAKEAREYINNNIDALNGTDRKLFTSEAPAYQQRAAAKNAASQGAWDRDGSLQSIPTKGTPETYRGLYEPEPGQSSNIKNITEQFAEINNRKNLTDAEKDIFKQVAANDAIMNGEIGEKFKQAMKKNNNKANDIGFKDISEATNTFIETKAPFNSVKEMLDYISTAKKPTKGIYPKSFTDRPDLMKFSGGDGSLANIADAQEKYNWYMNSYPSYGVAEAYGNSIKSNAAKSSKRYRNWLKKEAKNTYEKNTQPITRAERNAADMKTAEIEKKEIMDQYGISSKDYDKYADAAANTYIYIDKNGNPVNQMAGAGWPGGGKYFIDENEEVMPYLRGYAKRHPTVDEYIRMVDEEAEISRLAEAEAADIAREAGPAYDYDRYKNWSL